MRRKLWIAGMAAVIGVMTLLPRHASAATKSPQSICLAPGAICDNRDQCCSHFCNIDPGGPGTCT
jgi:hypothetical protein